MPGTSKSPSYELVSSDVILPLFNKRQYTSAIKKINELLFQKRLAPQRPIEPITVISSVATTLDGSYDIKLICKIITEYRIEFFAVIGLFDTPVTLSELQTASNRAGCTATIEFNE
jgi:hypothetical protein